jgi:hypothetical protein
MICSLTLKKKNEKKTKKNFAKKKWSLFVLVSKGKEKITDKEKRK